MSDLIKRFKEDLQLAGYAKRSIDSYGRGMLPSPSPLRTVLETFTSHGSSLHRVSLVGIPAN